jgi:TonB family protein
MDEGSSSGERFMPPADEAWGTAWERIEIRRGWPVRGFTLSASLHLLFLAMPLPAFLTWQPRKPAGEMVRIEYDLQWTSRPLYLPPISSPQDSSPRLKADRPEQERSAAPEAVSSQTLVSSPDKPNHPTETLLSEFGLERAELESRDLRLPNVVIPAPRAATPPLTVDLRQLSSSSAAGQRTNPPPSLPRPQSPAELAFAQSRLENLYPRLTADPQSPHPVLDSNAGELQPTAVSPPGVIALSAQPAAPRAVLELPSTQLRARFATGTGASPKNPAGLPQAYPGSEEGARSSGVAGGAGLDAPNLFSSPEGPAPPGPVIVGPAPANAHARESADLSNRETSPASTDASPAQQRRAADLLGGISPGTRVTTATARRVYTVYVNMPNLASQTGSWVLRFAELGPESETAPGGAADVGPDPPVALTKVDPKYPATARRARLEGAVVLYGIITKEGRVTEVAVVNGIDEQLDSSAVEAFRRWRFEPGRKNGSPIPLEVVVEIPFRLKALF